MTQTKVIISFINGDIAEHVFVDSTDDVSLDDTRLACNLSTGTILIYPIVSLKKVQIEPGEDA